MLDKIYEFAKQHCSDIKDLEYQTKKIGGYFCLNTNGDFEILEILETPVSKCVPALGNIGGSSANIIIEKFDTIIGDTKGARDADYVSKTQRCVERCKQLACIAQFITNVRNDSELKTVIKKDLLTKQKSSNFSFKINGLPIEDDAECLKAMASVVNQINNDGKEPLVGISSISGEVQEICSQSVKVKTPFGYDTPLAPFSKQASTSSYLIPHGMQIANIGTEDVVLVKAGLEALLNDPKHYNSFFRLIHWCDRQGDNQNNNADDFFDFLEFAEGEKQEEFEEEHEHEATSNDKVMADVLAAAQHVDSSRLGNVKAMQCNIMFCYAPADSRYRLYGFRSWNAKTIRDNIVQFKKDSEIVVPQGKRCIDNLRSLLFGLIPKNIKSDKKMDYLRNTFSADIERLIYSAYENKQIPFSFLRYAVTLSSSFVSVYEKKGGDQQRWTIDNYRNAIKIITIFNKRCNNMDLQSNAYSLGRAFATYQMLQEKATQGNSVSSQFTLASKYPARVFTRLAAGSKHHLRVRNNRMTAGLSVFYAKTLNDIFANIDQIPDTLSLEEQSQFILGYYHQNNIFYTRKEHDE